MRKEINSTIDIMCANDAVRITIRDADARINIIELEMTPEAFAGALGRLSYSPVKKTIVGDLSIVGKKHIHKDCVFEIPNDYANDKQNALSLIDDACPEGWHADKEFSSQNSFFQEDGQRYARTIIRTWIDRKGLNNE